jgi:hypothetical protein
LVAFPLWWPAVSWNPRGTTSFGETRIMLRHNIDGRNPPPDPQEEK